MLLILMKIDYCFLLLSHFRTKLEQERSMKEELEQEKSENSSLRGQINSLQLELNTLQSGEREMSNKFIRLRNSMEKYRNESKRLQEQLAKADQCSDELLSRQKMMWKENVDALEVQSQELKKKCNEGERKISIAANIHLKVNALEFLVFCVCVCVIGDSVIHVCWAHYNL